MESLEFVIGTTCGTRLKSGQYAWTVYVEVVEGNVDLITKVLFNIKSGKKKGKTRASLCPTKMMGERCNWKFKVSGRSNHGTVKVRVALVGVKGGKTRNVRVPLRLGHKRQMGPYIFRALNKPLRPNKIEDCNFGIELELSTSTAVTPRDVAEALGRATHTPVIDMMDDFNQAKAATDVWRVMKDSSITCPIGNTNCNKFELVSPILRGGEGISEVDRVLQALNRIGCIQVGRSMGFHVHIDVSGISTKQLVKVCQNFVKYERAIDSFMPKSRRDEEYESTYCKSNKRAVVGPNASRLERHLKIADCQTNGELARVMNPGNGHGDRYYKLNLQNLVTGRQPTLEFRQHSGTSNAMKVKNWVRFCMAFVHNSARLKYQFPYKQTFEDEELFELMMMHLVKDRCLLNYYRERRGKLNEEKSMCCEGCGVGGPCADKFIP